MDVYVLTALHKTKFQRYDRSVDLFNSVVSLVDVQLLLSQREKALVGGAAFFSFQRLIFFSETENVKVLYILKYTPITTTAYAQRKAYGYRTGNEHGSPSVRAKRAAVGWFC